MSYAETVYRFFGWWIINIDLLLILFILVGALFALFKNKKWAKRFILIACFGFVFMGLSGVSVFILTNLENRFPKLETIPPEAKGVIQLGGSFDIHTSLARHEVAYNLTASKLIRFVELAHQYPHLQLIFTGSPIEVEMAKKELQALGLDLTRVKFEGLSKNTRDNAAKTLELLNNNHGETWVLMTSAYHMPRAVGLFRKGNIKIVPYPVDYHTSGKYEWLPYIGLLTSFEAWNAASREWLDMFANYYLMGKTDELYPKP